MFGCHVFRQGAISALAVGAISTRYAPATTAAAATTTTTTTTTTT